MKTLDFDLSQTYDTHQRVATIGMYRVLGFFRDPRYRDNYSRMPPESEFQCEVVGDTRLRIQFSSDEALNQVIDAAQGDFQQGLVIPPGFCSDLNQVAAYSTALFHRGVSECFQPATRGGRRGMSLRNKDIQRWFFAEGNPGADLVNEVGCLRRLSGKGEGEMYTIGISPYSYLDVPKSVRFDKEGNLVKCVSRVRPKPHIRTAPGVFHPAVFQKWNNQAIKKSKKDTFALSFAWAAYVYAIAADGMVGIGIDAPTFSEADEAFLLYTDGLFRSRKMLGSIGGGPRIAAGLLAHRLGLASNRTYHVVHRPRGSDQPLGFLFQYTTKQEPLLGTLKGIMVPIDADRTLWRLKQAPLRMLDKANRRYLSVYDQVLQNLETNRPWFADLGHLLIQQDLPYSTREALYYLSKALGDEMEQVLSKGIRWCFWHFRQQLMQRGIGPRDALQKAKEYIAKVQLAKVRNRGTLLAALRDLVNKVDGWNLSPEFRVAIESMDPLMARDIMTLELNTIRPKPDGGVNEGKEESGTPKKDAPHDDITQIFKTQED